MKTYQLDSEPKILYFTNYYRIDEQILFQQVLTKLKSCEDVEVGRKQIGPSEDLYRCKLQGSSFGLLNDIDYGTYIRADAAETIQKLKCIFEISDKNYELLPPV